MYKQKEIGDYRISVYHDDDPLCPYKDFDLVGKYIYDNNGFCCGNVEEFGRGKDIDKVLRDLVLEYVPNKALVKYIKEYVDYMLVEYDRSRHEWIFKESSAPYRSDASWDEFACYAPDDFRSNGLDDVVSELAVKDMEYLMEFCQKEVAFITWESTGYGQGEYVEGFAYCDKKRFLFHYVGEKNWRKRAAEAMRLELKDIERWLWGDVLGFVLEKKVSYKKIFDDPSRKPVEGYDWEEEDSCWGYYMDDADDLIENVVKEYDLPKKTA